MAEECQGLAELTQVVDRLCRSATSPEQARQYRMVLGEIRRAVEGGLLPVSACAGLRDLLAPHVLAAYLTVAREGLVRAKPDVYTQVTESENTERQRHLVLTRLGMLAGVSVLLPERPPLVIRDAVTAEQREALWRHLVDEWRAWRPDTGGALAALRLAAAVGVIIDTGARSGELIRQTAADVTEDLLEVSLSRYPQHGQSAAGTVDVYATSARTRSVLGPWMDARAKLVGRLQGTAPASLWVTVRGGGNPDPRTGARQIAGMPCSPTQLRESYIRAVRRLNEERSGAGLSLLPRRLEQLRRSVAPERIADNRADAGGRAPAVGDDEERPVRAA